MNILILEPFFTGSHAEWVDGYARHSRHRVDRLTLRGNHWKWRMHGGGVTLARKFNESDLEPELIVATDMLDITTFLALTRERTTGIPTAVYFHENQLTYPWSPNDRDLKRDRDKHYSFINFVSALTVDRVYFNSQYHMDSFLAELPRFLQQFPDYQELAQVELISGKSAVLPLGMDLSWFDEISTKRSAPRRNPWPLVLWNHRWEYDKNPDDFFKALNILSDRGHAFDVALVGETFDVTPDAFIDAADQLEERVIHSGYVKDKAEYADWLWRADILPVTSNHDFFGVAVMEALYCGCFPLLPRRLSYPELIPAEMHPLCFYDDFDDLVARLEKAITEIDETRSTSFREVATKFDWWVMSPVYDATFEALVASK